MPRRSTRQRISSDDPVAEVDESISPNGSRRSNRSTKFSSSLKEPDNSIKDLLGGLSETLPQPKKQKTKHQKKKKGNSDSDSELEGNNVARRTSSRNRSSIADSQPSSVKGTPLAKKSRPRRYASSPKSPAVRHSSTRKMIRLEQKDETDSEEDSGDESDTSSVESEEQAEIKFQRIIAVKMESRRKWMEISKDMNTSEIDDGSRWFQEEPVEDELDKFEERFLIKWADLSFLHCSWERKADMLEQAENAKTYLTTFFRKNHNGFFYDADERMDGEFFDPSFVQIERILEVSPPDEWVEKKMKGGKNVKSSKENWGIIHDIDHPDYENGTGRSFLIKWGNTSYSDATYEYERDLMLMDVEYETHLEEFERRSLKPTKSIMKKAFSTQEDERRRLYKIFGDRVKDGKDKEKCVDDYRRKLENYDFRNAGQLRDYQAEGVSWLLANHVNKRSAILADEMGLGKTIQTAAYIEMICSGLQSRGPFLIVAPLSTIPHWQREFQGWTHLNTIVYHGSQNDRNVIREFEFAFECDRPQGGVGINQRYLKKCHNRKSTKAERIWMTQVVITTPEMLVTDDFNELTTVEWELLVVDEAHRLKSHTSKLAVNLRDDRFIFNHTLLLTGTPIQNNMNELWALMNVVDPDEFDDCESFMERYDNMQSKERVDELHDVIRPYMLRRLKEDVEKSVPPKEETLIEVELTVLQKQYYRALYEKNVQFLHRDVKRALDGPSLNNLSMQLRKCCNHPFLLKGVEEKAKQGQQFNTPKDEADFLAKSSGKLVLLDKLLPKLKDNGHRVLIFSQFKIMLDIIEDYLSLREFKQERIDGSITGKKRQMAIDRFQSKSLSTAPFVMLLSTRAGGVGINLTAADTCIIFDSDWNPQNDLQAQARCHRIGQTKSVKVYRLLTRKTYEMQMFHMSSLKMGLDQAVLQGIENTGTGNDGSNMTKEEVERLLRHGAYDMFQEENVGTAEKESNEFMEQDIDTILERRTKTVVHDNTGSKSNAAGGTFSKASFKAFGGSETKDSCETLTTDVDIDDPDFWKKMVGEAKFENKDILESDMKRSRSKTVSYNEAHFEDAPDESLTFSYVSSSASEESDTDSEQEDNPSKQIDDFDFTQDIQNGDLRKLMKMRKEELSQFERKRWGGKLGDQWLKEDTEFLVKQLLRYGYGNIDWSLFYSRFKEGASKEYDDIEIKRMCWSLCFVGIQEAARENVLDVARRMDREAKKKRVEQTESVLQNSGAADDTETFMADSEEWKKHQLSQSFDRYWSSSHWVKSALADVAEFAKGNRPRDPKMLLEKDSNEAELSSLRNAFEDNILPALKNRGWTEQTPSASSKKKTTMVGVDGSTYTSIAEILDRLPWLHPELVGSVCSIITDLVGKIEANEANSMKIDFSLGNLTAAEGMNAEKLSSLLQYYGTCQLVIDREKSRKVHLTPQRLLSNISYVRSAHILVNKAKDNRDNQVTQYSKLAEVLDTHPKASLPHPQWIPIHDAILVTAISKHGWIDRDSHCRAIINDAEIKWGAPFDKSSIDNDKCISNLEQRPSKISENLLPRDTQKLRLVADRVATFFNDEHEAMKTCKGFNLNLVLNSYRIVSAQSNDEDSTSRWEVHYGELENSTENDNADRDGEHCKGDEEFSRVELPTRKDLLRRAKLLLSKSLLSDTGEKGPGVSHEFSVLDQSDVCNIFLAELLRESIKVGQKQQKWISKLLSTAHVEAGIRASEYPHDSNEAKEVQKIATHILMAKHNSTPFIRPSKNVLRAILGMEVHHSSKTNESTFVAERKPISIAKKNPSITSSMPSKINIDRTSPGKKIKGKKKARGLESTAGDAAINKALSIGKYSERNIPIPRENFLRLTSIETLMLSVLCSQGMPVCDENWQVAINSDFDDNETYALSWYQTGSVLEAASETWYSMTDHRVKLARQNGDEVSVQLQAELHCRQLVYAEASKLRQEPNDLAKKAIMLVEAVRLHSGNRLKGSNKKDVKLGMRTLQWSSNHMVKWGQVLGVFFDGRIIPNSVIANRPGIMPTAYVDEKGCAAIYSQIVQQSRLRTVYLKYEGDIFSKMLAKASTKCDANVSEWEDRPSWWCDEPNTPTNDDENLICGILQYGYGGFDEMVKLDERFRDYGLEGRGGARFDRFSAQARLDCLTRELSAIDDTAESLRLINNRRQNPQMGRMNIGTAYTTQVGIDAFFVPKIDENSSNDSSVEIVETLPFGEKRKVHIEKTSSEKKVKK